MGKTFCVHGLEDTLIVKMVILPRAIYSFNAVPIIIPMSLFTKIEKNPRVHMEPQKTSDSQSHLGKEEQKVHFMISNYIIKLLKFKQDDIGIKTYIDQWNRTEGPGINPDMSSQVIFRKGAKNTQEGNDSLFNKWFLENWIPTGKKLYI